MTIRRLIPGATALLMLSACAVSGPTAVSSGIAGSAWELVEFQSMDDAQGTTRPGPGQRYSVQFGADGTASFQLNCNRGAARWTAVPAQGAHEGTLRFGSVALTRAFCPPPSLDTRLAQHLEFVRSYMIRDGIMSMSLMADGGTYRWRRMAAPAISR